MSSVRYETEISSVSVQVRKGDLTAESVDAIVNAANEHLAHGGGLAAAIVRAGGQTIQQESRNVAPVPTGSAKSTGAGSLPCQRVIHAVGPIWSRQSEQESDRLLASAIRAALEVAAGEGLASISIPAISSGIFGFPKDRCARISFETIEAFLAENPDSSLREIRLCNFDEQTVGIFEEEAKRRYASSSSSTQ